MNIKAKCSCGATVDLTADSSSMYGRNDSFADGRVMEMFEKWTEKHRNCSSIMADANRPVINFPKSEYRGDSITVGGDAGTGASADVAAASTS